MSLKKEVRRFTEFLTNSDSDTDLSLFETNSPELSELKSVFNKYTDKLKKQKELAEQKSNEYMQFFSENEMLQSDRIVAEQIQQSMLEKKYPAFDEFPHVDLYADMDSAKEIGGDFYDYFKIDDTHICFSVADVEGKGVSAAMYMAVAKTLIRLRLESGEQLSEVISSVNKQLCMSSMQRRFISMWIGILDVSKGNLSYVNAGHNPPVIVNRDCTSEFLKNRSGMPLASYYSKRKPPASYIQYETELKKGDTLILYTDGITEATNCEGELFGEKRLIDACTNYVSKHTSHEISSYLKRCILNFSSSTEQTDDITIMTLKIN